MGHVKRLQAELEGMQDVLRRRDMDLQRTKMIIKLKEDKIARLQVRASLPSNAAACLRQMLRP